MDRADTRPARPRLRWGLVLATAAVVVLIAGLAWWLLPRSHDPEPVVQAAEPLTEPRAQEIAEQLTSGDETQVRQAFVVPAEQPLDPALAQNLAGIDLRLDTGTFAATSSDTATVEATVTDADGGSADWTLALLLTDAGWQVLHTVPSDEVPG